MQREGEAGPGGLSVQVHAGGEVVPSSAQGLEGRCLCEDLWSPPTPCMYFLGKDMHLLLKSGEENMGLGREEGRKRRESASFCTQSPQGMLGPQS